MILPFPVGAASPFRSWERDLLGEPGDSHTVKGSVLRISNFPAWRRNFSSSLDNRLNCSLWVRHFSSSSRTLAYEGEEDQQAGRKIDRSGEMGENGQERNEENQAWLNSWAHGHFLQTRLEANAIERGSMPIAAAGPTSTTSESTYWAHARLPELTILS